MAVLLQIRDAVKSFGDQKLLDEASATIYDGVKVGFVGRNGAGKSTLLKALLAEEELDSGEIIRNPKLRVGYLRQHDPFLPGENALQFLMRDSGQPDWKCGEVAGEFEIKGAYLEGPISALSGGWQTRVKLAALLLHEPNLLLLDEPTNFLDLRTQILLEHFLKHFEEACLIVSHDRAFLGATCTQTLDLTRGKLTLYPGPIEDYLQYRDDRREHDERANAAVVAKQKQLQKFIDKNKARASTATRAKSKEKQLEKLQTVDIAADEPTPNMRAPIVTPRQGPAVRCMELAIGYGDYAVAKGINLEIDHGQRAAIVGDNGQGKTTLLRTIVDSLPPVSGEVRWGYGCEIGVYAQHVYSSLPPDQTVLEYLDRVAKPGTTTQEVLAGAGALLFRGGHVKKKVSVLSGGERARLCMAGLLLGTYNVLILDEPGNHLDVETVESLTSALLNYKGTVIFTSHDRHFMKNVATSVIEVRDGSARNYGGDYDAYVYAVNKEIEQGERELAAARKKLAGPPVEKLGKVAKPAVVKDERALRKEMTNLERTIAKLDQQKKDLNAQLLQSTDPKKALKLHEELTTVTEQLSNSEDRWCEIQADLEGWDV
ncbi:ABC-F family ATP-binding cassette domain-containing protein [Planctomicrobium piriforme]|uniref:ATP-binding cassette, subfamily F, member 3 n=1 Tax=Planctomicrobium piriforme TaxID=1576369 RepID=A0A1I3HQW3_9PLAN|nr:ABC-F family ATP-binding cassette domain-containing protein [Planctomicrobium piriforme]SFI37920.1 ATP-binding cassette, subfamily F, member 3 [Planctomicrobium piriforme]